MKGRVNEAIDHSVGRLVLSHGQLSFDASIAGTSQQLRERSAEPADLLAQLSFVRSEYEEALRDSRTPGAQLDVREELEGIRVELAAEREATRAEQARRLEAERRAHEAETLLSMMRGSKSWAITSPLRSANTRLRGLGR